MTAQDRLRTLDERVLGPHSPPPPETARKVARRTLAIGLALLVAGIIIRLTHPLPPLEAGLWIGGIFLVGASSARLYRNRE